MVDEDARTVKQRIVCLIGIDLRLRHVCGLQIGAGVAVQPDTREVEKGRAARATHVGGGPCGDHVGVCDVKSIATEVVEPCSR